MLTRAAPGEVVTVSAKFYDEDGLPILTATGSVKYTVYDPANRLVLKGTATQDLLDLALFGATFTIPQTAPATQNNDKYQLTWRLKTIGGESHSMSEAFDVIPTGDDEAQANATSLVYYPGTAFTCAFQFQKYSNPSTVTFSVIDETGVEVATAIPVLTSDGRTDTFSIDIPAGLPTAAPTGNQGILMAIWQLRNSALGSHVEIQSYPIYYITPYMLTLVHAMQQMLDKGVLRHVHPYLAWDTPTFIHHMLKGFEYVNGSPPKITAFSQYTSLPVGLTQFIEKSAAVSALRAQLMAEAQSSFDFQGMQTQLTVDRTPILESLIGQYNADLEKLPDWKKNWITSGSPVAAPAAVNTNATDGNIYSAITGGPYTNYEGFVADEAYSPGVVSSFGIGYRGGGRRRL